MNVPWTNHERIVNEQWMNDEGTKSDQNWRISSRCMDESVSQLGYDVIVSLDVNHEPWTTSDWTWIELYSKKQIIKWIEIKETHKLS